MHTHARSRVLRTLIWYNTFVNTPFSWHMIEYAALESNLMFSWRILGSSRHQLLIFASAVGLFTVTQPPGCAGLPCIIAACALSAATLPRRLLFSRRASSRTRTSVSGASSPSCCESVSFAARSPAVPRAAPTSP